MTDRISLLGIETFAHHGVLPHERALGQRFVIDAVLDLDHSRAAETDELADTIDYGALVVDLKAIAEGTQVQLLERLCELLAARCLEDRRVESVEITIHKPMAPVPLFVRDVAVSVVRRRT
ncbi:MAG: putative dihydroneopterin aldolase [Actinomycetota bacterium]|jgi:dihydroneopterin aldolase